MQQSDEGECLDQDVSYIDQVDQLVGVVCNFGIVVYERNLLGEKGINEDDY